MRTHSLSPSVTTSPHWSVRHTGTPASASRASPRGWVPEPVPRPHGDDGHLRAYGREEGGGGGFARPVVGGFEDGRLEHGIIACEV